MCILGQLWRFRPAGLTVPTKKCVGRTILTWLLTVAASYAMDKSGVSPNTISLPSGPGSIEGLGEAFQPSLNTGTAKYNMGLLVPPGTAGHAPSLSLRYEGGSGNGPLGFGWSLGQQFVQRQCDKGIPRYVDEDNMLDDDRDGEVDEYDERDVFINDAKEELVPQESGYFFCENEGAFIRYYRTNDYWIGTLPTGARMEFGVSESARIRDPDTGGVYRWCIENIVDTHGNTIHYTYTAFPTTENLNQIYCSGITYGPGAPPWDNFHFVRMQYEDRLDWFEDGRSGFFVRTGKRLAQVVIGTQGPELPGHVAGDFSGDGITDYLVRRYQLDYLRYAGTNSHWSLLASVKLIGADDTNGLPPATFDYAVCDPPDLLSNVGHEIGGVREPPFVMDNALVDLLDLNGDGLPDILKTDAGGGQHTGYLNLGEVSTNDTRAIQWSSPKAIDSLDELAWNVDLQSSNNVAHLADMDGDGVSDLAVKTTLGDVFYFANEADLSWGPRQSMSIEDSAPPAPFGNPDVRTADLDFDKRVDIVQSIPVGDDVEYRIWFNAGQQRYAKSLTVPQTSGLRFSQPGVDIADFNGDRVPDVVRLFPSQVRVAAGLGYGRFAEPVSVPIPGPGLEPRQITQANLQDVTGDGLADLVLERPVPGQLWYWLNLGNYTFGSRKIITDMPTAVGTAPEIRWADLNGNGTVDLIYADSQSSPRLRTVDIGVLLDCVPGHNVLTSIANGMGRVTTVVYTPSTRFALDDAAAGRPWPQLMPFPVTVVSEVITSDLLGHDYVTRFRYHDGYYDGEEKEFRGFARVEQIEVGDLTAPTLVTRSVFDTGQQYESLKGALLEETAEQEDGQVFWHETTTWTRPPKMLMTGVNGQPVFYAHPTTSRRHVQELGEGEERMLESEFGYDAFGNSIREISYGIVVDNDRSAFDDERIMTTEYAINTNAWLIRFPSRSEIQDEHGQVISRNETYYDDPTFAADNLGEVAVGDATLSRDWIEPDQPDAFVNASRIQYDPFGNPVRFLDPLAVAPDGIPDPDQGHWREVRYDVRLHTFAERETIHVGDGQASLVVHAEYDEGFETLDHSLDFNGNETTYGYDMFGRLTHMIRPGDTETYPTTEYDYALAVPIYNGGIINYIETRALDRVPGSAGVHKRDHYLISRQFTDGLGRALLSKTEAEPVDGGTQPRVVVDGAVLFNARMQVSTALNPFFSTLDGDNVDALLVFEDIEQPEWVGIFHERGELKPLDLTAAHKARLIYDSLLRPCDTINPDGTRTRVIHEPLVDRSFDENDTDPTSAHFNTPVVSHRDGLQRHIRTDEIVRLNDDGTAAGQLITWTTHYAYDLNDRLLRVTDSQGNVKRMEYDGLQRMTFMDDPDCGVVNHIYDEASNLIEMIDAKNQRTTYSYDGANRLQSEDYHDETKSYSFGYVFDPLMPISAQNRPDVAYFYDRPVVGLCMGDGTTETATYTKGNLSYLWDLAGEQHHAFDRRGRLAWIVKRIPDPATQSTLHTATDPDSLVSYKTTHTYDSMDRTIEITYPDNDAVEQQYNERGTLLSISGDKAGSILTVPAYLPSGQAPEIRYGNNVTTSQAYDNRMRLRTLLTRPHEGDIALIHFQYDLDPVSNVRTISDLRSSASVPNGSARRNSQFLAYDDLYRLNRVQYAFQTPENVPLNNGEIRYRYDRIGNMLSKTSDIAHLDEGRSVTDLGDMVYGGKLGAWNQLGGDPGSPGPHALTKIIHPQSPDSPRDYLYDKNGNMVQIDGLDCTWDFKDRLVAVENERMRAEYTYDHTDRRTLKKVTPKDFLFESKGMDNTEKSQFVEKIIPLTTTYVSGQFELRNYDQPIKYIWNSDGRVARVMGTLSHRERIQRIRMRSGWNLIALAVETQNAWSQIGSSDVYRWVQESNAFQAMEGNLNLSAGTVLWVKTSATKTIYLKGIYPQASDLPIPEGNLFWGGQTLNAMELNEWIPINTIAWDFDETKQVWRSRLGGGLDIEIGLQDSTITPGQAVFVRVPPSAEPRRSREEINIRFYHQDHLHSSSVVTDLSGALVQETTFYPFGNVRGEMRSENRFDTPYLYTGKERDHESGMYYYEARYYHSTLARFISVDPLNRTLGDAPANTQSLSSYAYTLNRPFVFIDPTGLSPLRYENTYGISVSVNVIVGDVGGSLGLNIQKTDMQGWALYGVYPTARRSEGFSIGFGPSVNWGKARGSWEGKFEEGGISVGVVGGGRYWSPDASGTTLAYGAKGYGAGAFLTETEYKCHWGCDYSMEHGPPMKSKKSTLRAAPRVEFEPDTITPADPYKEKFKAYQQRWREKALKDQNEVWKQTRDAATRKSILNSPKELNGPEVTEASLQAWE